MSTKEYTYTDKSIYIGEWSAEGHRDGRGKLTHSSGMKYTGDFHKGFQHGFGIMIIPDSDAKSSHRFEGQFAEGCFDGFGIFTRSDGMKYEGQFSKGNITGLGLITFKDGCNGVPRYEGKFEDGKLVKPCACSEEVNKAKESAMKALSSFENL